MSSISPARISAISYYLPSTELTNEQLNELFPEWSVDKIMNKVGITSRRVAAQHECTSDLAVQAAKKLIEEYQLKTEAIEFLILCTQTPDYFLPTTACLIHERLGLLQSAGAIDINQGCSGFIYGLSLAKGLIASGEASNVLLITAETYSKLLHPEDKGNRSIFGDGAAAIYIHGEQQGGYIEKIVLGTNGTGAPNLIVKNGAMRSQKTGDKTLHTNEEGNPYNDNYLYMNGAEIFNFTLESVPLLVNKVLEKNKLTLEEIDLFVFHQANKFMLDYLRKKIKIPTERFFVYMAHCGNTVSSTIPIALKNAFIEGKIKPGSRVLIAGFGVGYSWGGTVLQF
ncbi:MAG: ketoacyl-ACP synthase III [Chitinophagaceae bacterium]|nr:ketoacyl-ACP synthase III [Chitinophagaceae bacterium]